MICRLLLTMIAVCGISVGPSTAEVRTAHPVDSLLQAAPADAQVYAVLRDVRVLAASEWRQRLEKIPAVTALLQSNETKNLLETLNLVFTELGTTPEQIRDEIFGDAMVFSYSRSSTGRDEDDRALIAGHARDPKLAAQVLKKINEVQVRNKEIASFKTSELGQGILYRRYNDAGQVENVIWLEENTFAIAGKESQIDEFRKRRADRPASPIPGLYASLGLDRHPLALFLNPRMLDVDLQAGAQEGSAPEKAFLGQLIQVWKAIDAIGVYVDIQPDPQIGLSIRARTNDLSPELRQFLSRLTERNPMWDQIGPDPLFAIALRFDLASFMGAFRQFLTTEDRARFMDDLGDTLGGFFESGNPEVALRGLGHDMGLWILPPKDTSWLPRFLAAVRIADTPEGPETQQALLKSLEFLAQLINVTQKEVRLRREKLVGPGNDNLSVQYLTLPGEFPKELRPAFTARSGHVLLASSPQVLLDFTPPSGTVKADEIPLMRISFLAWRDYWKRHGTEVKTFFKKTSNDQQFDKLQSFLQATEGIDRFELSLRPGKDLITISMKLQLTR